MLHGLEITVSDALDSRTEHSSHSSHHASILSKSHRGRSRAKPASHIAPITPRYRARANILDAHDRHSRDLADT